MMIFRIIIRSSLEDSLDGTIPSHTLILHAVREEGPAQSILDFSCHIFVHPSAFLGGL